MKAKEGFFDRFEQSFKLMIGNFKNFINIFGLYFLYKFVFILILGNILYFSFVNLFDFQNFIKNGDSENFFALLFGNSEFVTWVNIYLVYLLVNLLLVIPFIIATFKTIKDYFYEKNEISIMDNLVYGFKSLGKSFNTYWYMFAYVALIPMIILIIGGLLFLIGEYKHIDSILQVGMGISGLGFFLLLIFSIYKGLKTSFSLVCAVDENLYTKENFKKSLKITQNNWWRIFGNFLLVSLILSVIFGIVNSFIGILKFSVSDIDYTKIIGLIDGGEINKQQLDAFLNGLTSDLGVFSIKDFSFEVLDLILNTLKIVFIFVFTFIFYKRLEFENSGKNDLHNLNANEKNIEL